MWLFGSLAWGGAHERSDLDVAVEGVPPAELDRAHAELWELLGEPVDLVPIESAAASLAQQIRERGEVLL
ncbi:MAG: nucleotidyltransferase domain-containing protein [Myxococcales bacterium]|nr:nucleotidyltransferase domain-containing protein [Myxococcales bacterium]